MFGQCQQFLNFGLELDFQLLDMPMRERTVARGIGMDLGAIKAHGAQFEQLQLLRVFEPLHKETGPFVEETSAEGRQGMVIGMVVGGDVAEGNRVIGRPLQPATGEDASGVAINQDRQ